MHLCICASALEEGRQYGGPECGCVSSVVHASGFKVEGLEVQVYCSGSRIHGPRKNSVSLTSSRLPPILANRKRDFLHGLTGIDTKNIVEKIIYLLPLLALNRRTSKTTVNRNENFKVFASLTGMDTKFSFGQSQPCQMTSRPIKKRSSASYVTRRWGLRCTCVSLIV